MKVKGFKAAGLAAGLRYQEKMDLGLIAADTAVNAAGVFTTNLVKAAPVLWSREQLAGGRARAILVNSGQANACTGQAGLEASASSARAVAAQLGCGPEEVLVASTGVIGEQLNLAALEKAAPELAAGLDEDGLPRVAQAMMTTDTYPKMAEARGLIDGREFNVVGLVKGAGMICPNMATMLCFVLTDAACSAGYLREMLGRHVEHSFNRVTVDGDTSTNDCVLVLAGGLAGNAPLENEQSLGSSEFEQAFSQVLSDLSRMIIADGEGATKLVTIAVSGAADQTQAKAAAMTVANSPLVKTALFGEDANWGRIMGALGRSGADFDPDLVDIDLNQTPLVRQGVSAGTGTAADEIMRQREFSVNIDLHAGPGRAQVLTCDLSLDYVKINAHYRS
jgi:glutamate N-acetyltransferase/amino-acid N-acetyltransferase